MPLGEKIPSMPPPFARKFKETNNFGEDYALPSGRLKAAMIQAGREPVYTELIAVLNEKLGIKVNKQTAHNWFKPTSKFIDPRYLFDISNVLNVSARWLATGKGAIQKPRYLSPEEAQILGMWEALQSNKTAAEQWMREGDRLLNIIGSTNAAHPYKQ